MSDGAHANLVMVLEHALVKCPQCGEPNATSVSLTSRLARCSSCANVLIVPSLQMLELYRSASENRNAKSWQKRMRERLVGNR